MALFYQNLLEEHMTVPTALQAAQVFMWQKRKLPPYYWAAFHMQGEWQGKLQP
jgi:CHAT domain-containing protein